MPTTMTHPKMHRQQIVLVAGIILVVLTVLVGATVFVVMQRNAEELLYKSLQSSLQNRVYLTEAEIKAGFGRTTVAATRPQLIGQVQRLNKGEDDGTARSVLDKLAESFLPTGLTAFAVFDKGGRELARAGTFTEKSLLSVPLHLPGRAQLIWHGKLLLHAAVEMTEAGQVVGRVVTETPLTATTAAFKDASRLGNTGELVLCAPIGMSIQCFPTTLNSNVMTMPRIAANGALSPMAHALGGRTGFIRTRDHRGHEVEAAYAPVGDFGLGMVLKIDGSDLYAPVWRQLRYLIPLLIGVLLIGLLLLRWLLAPLVLQLIRSEARNGELNTELEQRVQQRTAQLDASNRDLQEFAYSVAHDLRQPFIAIGGFSGLLQRTVHDERARHYIARINAGVRQASELTDALLALANLSRVQLHVQTVDISAIAHSVLGALQNEEPARQVSLSIQDGLLVQADPVLIKLVMRELLGNAWKFTSRRSHTEISFGLLGPEAVRSGPHVVYVVRDNGEGFPMAYADKLFRSFQRLHTAQDFPGAGTGLANIQRIVARHHGQIWAESVLGEGASFYFTLGQVRP